MTSLADVQAAVYTALTGDAELMDTITTVADSPSRNQPFPYVTLGEATEVSWDTFDRDGHNATLTLHVWSRYQGFNEAFGVVSRMNALIDYQPLPVVGRRLVYLRYEGLETLRDPDGRTRHVPVRYRVLTQEEADA